MGENIVENPVRPGQVDVHRRFPVGAELLPEGGVHFRVWAPKSTHVAIQLGSDNGSFDDPLKCTPLQAEPHGYFSGAIPEATVGTLYKLVLDTGIFPDPASRFQPQGPHGPSQVVDPKSFQWSHHSPHMRRAGQIVYEMHIGTFTPEGTWRSAMEQLPELAKLGVTLLEVMPIADFPGRFGWGYDGVCLYAPTRLYGTPDDFRAFIDRAHSVGLGVILDVVYNHFGPSGNYFHEFSDDYFTKRYENDWGEPLNFDGENTTSVREFFVTNAMYWIDEFHLDGLRLDATHQIFDASKEHVIAVISREARKIAGDRELFIVAENEAQKVQHIRPADKDGFNLDAIWNDDFHHTAMVALTGSSEAYYADYTGTPQEFISAAKYGPLYQGQWYPWQEQRRGTVTLDIPPDQFVIFLQNHDQVANSLRGARVHQLASPAQCRALTAFVLLGPNIPMLFQGQEFASSSPFFFFADHEPELNGLVLAGRRTFLHQFESLASGKADALVDNPADEKTFLRSKLDFAEREKNAHWYRLHQDLIKLRKQDAVFSQPRFRGVDGSVLGTEIFLLRFFGDNGDDRLLFVNLGINAHLSSVPEPLIAPPEGRSWKLLWSSEEPRYGGAGVPEIKMEDDFHIPGHAALVFIAQPVEPTNGKTDPKD